MCKIRRIEPIHRTWKGKSMKQEGCKGREDGEVIRKETVWRSGTKQSGKQDSENLDSSYVTGRAHPFSCPRPSHSVKLQVT